VATGSWVARVIGADIAVVALNLLAETPPLVAEVLGGALITIIARVLILLVNATQFGIARIVGAGVIIVAIEHQRGDTFPSLAVIARSTGIEVGTLPLVGGIDATALGIAGIIGARIIVVALQGFASQTFALTANVTHGADAAILAALVVGHVLATDGGVTEVVGADVAVVAVEGRSTFASAFKTGFADSATVTVVTGKSFVIRGKGTLPRIGVTGRFQAEGIDALGSRTLND